VHDPEDKLDSLYYYIGTEHQRWCGPCAVKQWECPIRFVFHLGVPDVVRERFTSIEMLKRLIRWNVPHKDLSIHVFDRRESETIPWMSSWGKRGNRPEEPYSYRGWCSGSEILLLFDETETTDSIEWILYHEIGHAVCGRARMFDDAMARENDIEGRTHYEWKDDIGHEADSEERLVNRMANAYMEGKERARPWWRPRVVAKQRGYTVLPDAFAPDDSPEFIMFCWAKLETWASPLPILGFSESRVRPQLNRVTWLPTEEQRKQPDFREKLVALFTTEVVDATESGTQV
jgi:hypothetical protein